MADIGQLRVGMTVDILPLQAGFAQASEASEAMASTLRQMNVPVTEVTASLNKAGASATAFAEKTEVASATAAASLKKVSVAANEAATGVSVLSSGMGILGGAVGIVGAGVLAMAEHMATAVHEESELAKATGISLVALDEMTSVFRAHGIETQRFNMILPVLARNIELAIDGSKAQTEAFNALGISTQFLDDNEDNLEAIILKIADGMGGAENKTKSLAAAKTLLGRNVAMLSGVLREGGDALQKEMWLYEEHAKAVAESDAAVTKLKEEEGLLVAEIQTAVLPGLKALPAVVAAIGTAFQVARLLVESFFMGTSTWLVGIGKIALDTGAAIKDALAGNFMAAKTDIADAYSIMNSTAAKAAQEEIALWQGATAKIHELWVKASSAPTETKPKKGKPITGGGPEVDAMTNTALLLNRIWAEHVEAEMALDKMLEEEHTRSIKATMSAEEAADKEAMERLNRQARMKTEEINKGVKEEERAAKERAKIIEQEAREAERIEQEKMHVLDRAINEPLAKMATGQMSIERFLQESWQRIAQNAITNMVRMMEQHLLMAAEERAMSAAQSAGLAAKKSVDREGQFSSAKKGAASVYASAADIPYVGWIIAPVAAAAAFAAMMAFEKGGIVPETNVALVHRNEMVLPSHISEFVQNSARQAGGGSAPGGAGATHFHYAPQVSAFDSTGVKGVLDRHGELFAASFQRWMRGKNMS